MKELVHHTFRPAQCRKQLKEFAALLKKRKLSELKHVSPFFKHRNDISMLFAGYIPDIEEANVVAHEYPICGDFRADLIVGNSAVREYLLVEFEDGAEDSIFKKIGKKTTLEWSPRFEHAFSQIVDWIWKLEDMRSTGEFTDIFGGRDARFNGLVVIGHNASFRSREKNRLRWRTDRILVDSHKISYLTFDEAFDDLKFRLKKRYGL